MPQPKQSHPPRLLAVNPTPLAARNAFTFAGRESKSDQSAWLDLKNLREDNAIPAIGDANTVTYALGKTIGDTINYTAQNGKTFQVRIIALVSGSLLQGSLIVDESRFLEKFPDSAGHHWFLVDAPEEQAGTLANLLNRQLSSRGLSLEPASHVLNRYNTVQNTYIGMFSVIGGLGILLATAGLAALMLRGALERQAELGVLRAFGFTRTALARLLVSEQWFLHTLAVFGGTACALLAVFPLIRHQPSELPWLWLVTVNALILSSGLLIAHITGKYAIHDKHILGAIRSE